MELIIRSNEPGSVGSDPHIEPEVTIKKVEITSD
jgi:hypothetical protein